MPYTSTILSAKDAIARHMQWRIALQFAVTIQEPLSADQFHEIQNDELCAIGRWLVSPATESIRASEEFENLIRAHYTFHREMETIAQLIAEGRYEEATGFMSVTSDFQQASHEIAMAIMAVDRLLEIAVPV